MTDTTRPFAVTAAGTSTLTAAQVRATRFSAPMRGVRAPRTWGDDHLSRARAMGTALAPGAFLCGPSAAALLGLPLPSWLERADVHVAAPHEGTHLRRARTVPRRLDVADNEIMVVDGVPTTSPVRTFLDLAWDLPEPDLVAVGDAVMRRWGASADEFLSHLDRRLRYRGKVRARDVIPYLTPLAESPQESRLRAIIIGAGLPIPTPQVTVRTPVGRFLGRVDLGYEEFRLALEYDGEHHADPEQYRVDARRRTAMRSNGWTVLEVVREDVRAPYPILPVLARTLNDLMPAGLSWSSCPWTPRQPSRHRPWV